LLIKPNDWLLFQTDFNSAVEKITSDILLFEKENIKRSESRLYRLKRIFEQRYRRYFLYGVFPRWVFEKPFGYAGDFKIIDDIYQNQSRSIGFDRLWDDYFLQMVAAKSTRKRKDDFKEFICDFVGKRPGEDVRIMSLASGPAREIKELLDSDSHRLFGSTIFDCYDFETRAINYAQQLLNSAKNVNFFHKNAVRLALTKDISREIPQSYDFIYCAGLYDYLDEKVAIRLTSNLHKLLKKNGVLLIANFGNKYQNSSAGLMEWATEWYLIYRSENEFEHIFLSSGFSKDDLRFFSQKNKVIVYCLAHAG